MIVEGPPPIRRITLTDDLIPTNQLVVILTPDGACYIDAYRDGNRCGRVGISAEEIGELCNFLMNPEEG